MYEVEDWIVEQNHAADLRDFALPELPSSDRGFFGQALEGIRADGESAGNG
jgi:hypothetical protein